MILQALTEHYETLSAQGKVDSIGWGQAKISYALCINDAGGLEQVETIKTIPANAKKKEPVPRLMSLPAAVKRTVGIAPNFLWDNSSYMLGVDNKGKPQRSLACFEACRELHRNLLSEVDSPAAKALLAFFEHWDPSRAHEHPALKENWEDILASANLVFRYQNGFVHEIPQIRQAWQAHYGAEGDGPSMVCLVTGKKGPVEAVHPAIKGVAGAQSSGAALVSFNAQAFCSYNREQNLNAPMGKYAAFAYTTALNYLLADREHVNRIGETTVLFWAKDGQSSFQNFFASIVLGVKKSYSLGDLAGKVKDLCRGKPVEFDETQLDPNCTFYILGVSPNAARISVRFFLRDSFGNFLSKIQAHYKRLYIERPEGDRFSDLFIPTLLDEVVNQNSSNKLYDELYGEMLRAILTDTQYPVTLRNFAYLRIRANRKINRVQASILKANLIKKCEIKPQSQRAQEVLQMQLEELNETCTNPAYLLGRLFSVMEEIQLASTDWKVNRSIKDSYFNSVGATPKFVFSKLFPLNAYHVKKLRRDKFNLAQKLEREKSEILSKLTVPIPVRFEPEEVDLFYIAYYHQNYKFEKERKKKKKEEKENV